MKTKQSTFLAESKSGIYEDFLVVGKTYAEARRKAIRYVDDGLMGSKTLKDIDCTLRKVKVVE